MGSHNSGPPRDSNRSHSIKSRESRTRLVGWSVLLTVCLACATALTSGATADSPTPLSCDPGAIQYAIAHGGSYQFDCSGLIDDPQDASGSAHAYVIPTGISVSFAATTGQNVVLDGLGQAQIFIIEPGASLTLSHVTLQNGMASAAAGSSGSTGVAGADGTAGSAGSNGSPAGLIDGTDGQPGSNPTAGSNATDGTEGSDAVGGAINNAGTLTMTDCTFLTSQADGAPGGSGGNGTAGGDGGAGGAGGDGATPQNTGTGGNGGSGGGGGNGADGSNGGAGAQGGNAAGGALYNAPAATATLTNCVFTDNSATGGAGGGGGQGGDGGHGGGAGTRSHGGAGETGNNASGGAGGTGGNGGNGGKGGTGGPGGDGGAGQGGAIYNNGGTLVIWSSSFNNNTATGGSGGTGGDGGIGGDGGQGGQGGPGGGAYQPTPGNYSGTGGAPGQNGAGGQGGNGGDGGRAGTGGDAQGGAIYSTNPIQQDGHPSGSQAATAPGIEPTSYSNNTVTAGNTPNGCATNASGCGGNGAQSIAAYPPATGGAPDNTPAAPGTPTTPGNQGHNAPDNTTVVLAEGNNTWIASDTSTGGSGASAPTGTSTTAAGSPPPTTWTRPLATRTIIVTGSDATNPKRRPGHINPEVPVMAAKGLEAALGFHPDPYNNENPENEPAVTSQGDCAIGYGTKLNHGPCTAQALTGHEHRVTKQTAQRLLIHDMTDAVNTVAHYVHTPLNPNQQAALIQFAYNIGARAFRGSTLLRDLNAGSLPAAANQLLRWTKADGTPLPQLAPTRAKQRELFIGTARTNDPSATTTAATSDPPDKGTAGHTITFTGQATAGCQITLTATVTGISPYPAITPPTATVTTNGTYTTKWHIPNTITDTLPWQISGTQNCNT